MDKRTEALVKALEENEAETKRWTEYRDDARATRENLSSFLKRLSVDIMVPIGSVALMPGQLQHTNEILVGHMQGYFSKCSASKAMEICEHRMRNAEEHLGKLRTERELWVNKLEMPQQDGVFARDNEFEGEFVTEEDHVKWIEQHKDSVRKHKEKERLERENKCEEKSAQAEKDPMFEHFLEELGDITIDEYLQLRQEFEELETLDNFQPNGEESDFTALKEGGNPETKELRKTQNISELSSDSNKLPDNFFDKYEQYESENNELEELETQAVSVEYIRSVHKVEETSPKEERKRVVRASHVGSKKQEPVSRVEKPSDLADITPSLTFETNRKNEIHNMEIVATTTEETHADCNGNGDDNTENNSNESGLNLSFYNNDDTNSSGNCSEDDEILPAFDEDYLLDDDPIDRAAFDEVLKISKNANFLPLGERPNFYKQQLSKLSKLKQHLKYSLEESAINARLKCSKMIMLMQDLLERTLDLIAAGSGMHKEKKTNGEKRRISFAQNDQILEFSKFETVTDMAENIMKTVKPDCENPADNLKNGKRLPTQQTKILDRVKSNIEYVAENQSTKDFDLVSQITQSTTEGIKTLHIRFRHSNVVPAVIANIPNGSISENLPHTPADIYDSYLHSIPKKEDNKAEVIYLDSFEGENEVKAPILREDLRKNAYEDPRAAYSTPPSANVLSQAIDAPKKSILRNKSAVDLETHKSLSNALQDKKKNKQVKKGAQHSKSPNITIHSAFHNSVHDVVVNTNGGPDALPKGKFIDAHATKKRISHFRQRRQGCA